MNIYTLDAAAIVVALICIRSWLSWRKRRANGFPLPPGPKGLPIIGNVLDMPGSNEWETARQWGEKYGDIVYIKNFGTRYVFINSYDIAFELFEKRGNFYSSRPQNTMIDLEGWSQWFTSVMPYGDELRKSRQYINKFFHKTLTPDHYEVQTQSTHKFLLRLLESPDDFREHIRHAAADSIIKIAYGYQISDNDPYVELTDRGMEAFSLALTFFLVNALPVLQYLPDWFPGTQFKKIAKEGYEACMEMYREPYNKAKAKLADGTAEPSMMSKLLEMYTDSDGKVTNETVIMKAVAISYAAGGDTTVSVMLTFLLAMVLYPEAIRKGQEELDRVIGKNNLPTFEDRAKLPYIEAICNECLRWQTVTPIAVPHLAEKDDVINGYFIPAGTTVYGNVWAMLRDPRRYPEPDKFIPERWLPGPGKEVPLEANRMAFGFGRRICPGRFFAENSVFIGIASVLAVFDISKVLDEHGVPISPVEDYTSAIIRHPKPFKCKITPRSEEAAALIRQAATLAKY
ncbi:hypothetical protein ACEPAH_2865 [Sanghuangporus vaninii]